MDFYYDKFSPPCRAVYMVKEALKLKMNMKFVDLLKNETMSEEFTKINPEHKVPAVVDGDFALWESRAICIYLVEKFGGENNPLYPNDPRIRAVINQRLFFDLETLYTKFAEYFYYAPFEGRPSLEGDLEKLKKAVGHLDQFLAATGFAAGTLSYTIADLVLFTSVSSIEVSPFDFGPFKNVQKWSKLMHEIVPGKEFNAEGAEMLRPYMKKD